MESTGVNAAVYALSVLAFRARAIADLADAAVTEASKIIQQASLPANNRGKAAHLLSRRADDIARHLKQNSNYAKAISDLAAAEALVEFMPETVADHDPTV